jgi:two-component system sensor histidine kinase TctE
VPEEITPLVRSLNDMLAPVADHRHAEALHRRRRAPDETPLAGMRMQSELALRQTDRAKSTARWNSWPRVRKRPRAWSTSCWHWRAPKTSRRPAAWPFDLGDLARNVVQDWVPASFAHRIDLGYEAPPSP